MTRGGLELLAAAFGLVIATAAGAHHPPRMESCQSYTFAGQVERIDWHNPHVELFIRAAGGTIQRLTWLNMHQLGRAGIEQETLRVGDQVIVTAGTRDDLIAMPMLLSNIRRVSDGWEWSQVPQGC